MAHSLPTTVVLDTSVTIWALVPAAAPVDVLGLLKALRQAQSELHAPALWLAECTSLLRRQVHLGLLLQAEGERALDDLFSLEVRIEAMTPDLCLAAFRWATRLGRSRAYDGFYLATAEGLDAVLVTGDRRLVHAAEGLGKTWVKWVGDVARQL